MRALVRRTLAATTAALALALPLAAAMPAAPASASPSPVLFGLYDHWYPDYTADDTQLGVQQGIYGTFANWGSWQPSSAVNFFTWARGRGALPMMTFDPPVGSSLSQINAGQYDAVIADWARHTAAYGHPVLVRLFPEMNTTAHDYALNKHPGNTPDAFKAAFRRVVNIWRANDPQHQGRFVFNPNRVHADEPDLSNYWPGAQYVDWNAIDAYNFWDASTETRTVKGAVSATAGALRALPGAGGIPMFIAEIGATENPGKAQWISEIPQVVQDLNLKMAVWWNEKENGTRFDTSSASLTAGRNLVRTSPLVVSGGMSLADSDTLARTPTTAPPVLAPIEQKYQDLGGSGSYLGDPTAAEVAVSGGRMRQYAHGRIYWSTGTGAWSVAAGSLNRYVLNGETTSWLGFPTSESTPLAGGYIQSFKGGKIYWSAGTNGHAVGGGILNRYLAKGGPAVVGFPSNEFTLTGIGYVQPFTGTTIYWSSATSGHTVGGAIGSRFNAIGGATSYAGFPTAEQAQVTGGWVGAFQGAHLYWSSTTGARVVRDAIRTKYLSLGGPSSSLGLPTTDQYAVTGGVRSSFQHGTITYYASSGTSSVKVS